MSSQMPKIAIIGYGAMGKEIEKSAKLNNLEVVEKFDLDNPLRSDREYDFEVAIDFSIPKAVIDNVKILSDKKINIVIGATGWYDNLPIIEKFAKESGIGLLWGANFSIGMNIFMKITEMTAKLTSSAKGYDVFINEMHHTRKKDSPSGSALVLADIIMKEFPGKTEILAGNALGAIEPEALQITSTRAGDIMGTHEVTFTSPADSIELKHTARSREGFAEGAILAAKWIFGKKGIYKFDQILNDIWSDTK